MSGAVRIRSGYRDAILDPVLDRISGRWARYGFAVAIVALEYGVSRLFGHFLDQEVYLLPFVSILIVSVVGGLGPGLLATALAGVATFRLVPGVASTAILRLATEGALVSFVGGSLRRERL